MYAISLQPDIARMSGAKGGPGGDQDDSFSLDSSGSSSFNRSQDLNSTGGSLYPNLSMFKDKDGSGDHAWRSTDENSSGSSEDGGSPKRVACGGFGGTNLRSGRTLPSPRQGIHENKVKVTPRQQRGHRPKHGDSYHLSQPDKPPRTTSKPPWWHTNIDIAVAFVIFALLFSTVLWGAILSLTQDEHKTELVEMKDEQLVIVTRFKTLFAELRAEFPSQSKRFWRIIQAATQSMLSKPHPTHPAVVLLASDNSSVTTASCIARRFGSTVARSYVNETHPPTLVDCASFTDRDAGEFKLNLHGALEAQLRRGSKVAVIDNLQMTPGGAVDLFHGYCDNENAPYLEATFVLTLHVNDVVIDEPNDVIVEDFLDRVWGQDVEKENLAALYSRIANNIAFVNAEASDLIATLC